MSETLPIAVPDWLHNYGMNQYQFRLYAHLCCLGDGCSKSIKAMAKVCRMRAQAVCSALNYLEAEKLVVREKRDGQTNIYRVKSKGEA